MKQGCVSSAKLFNLYSDAIPRKLETLPGFIIGGHKLNNIRYANDIVLTADSESKQHDLRDK